MIKIYYYDDFPYDKQEITFDKVEESHRRLMDCIILDLKKRKPARKETVLFPHDKPDGVSYEIEYNPE